MNKIKITEFLEVVSLIGELRGLMTLYFKNNIDYKDENGNVIPYLANDDMLWNVGQIETMLFNDLNDYGLVTLNTAFCSGIKLKYIIENTKEILSINEMAEVVMYELEAIFKKEEKLLDIANKIKENNNE